MRLAALDFRRVRPELAAWVSGMSLSGDHFRLEGVPFQPQCPYAAAVRNAGVSDR